MKRHGLSRRTMFTAIVMLAAAVGGVVGFSLLDNESEPAQGSEPEVVVLASGDLGSFAEFQSIVEASKVNSFAEANALAGVAPAVFVVDSSFATSLKTGDLRSLVSSGSAVIGLDIPLSQLNDLTGFEEELKLLNPRFAGQLPPQDKPAVSGQFYSLVWRTPEGANPAYWGRLQHALSDGLFEAVVNGYKLRVQGLIADGDGVVPIEQYGR